MVPETKTDSKWSAIPCNFSQNLKTVEFQVAEDAVVILVGNVKDPAEGSNTQRFELGEIIWAKTSVQRSFVRAWIYNAA